MGLVHPKYSALTFEEIYGENSRISDFLDRKNNLAALQGWARTTENPLSYLCKRRSERRVGRGITSGQTMDINRRLKLRFLQGGSWKKVWSLIKRLRKVRQQRAAEQSQDRDIEKMLEKAWDI